MILTKDFASLPSRTQVPSKENHLLNFSESLQKVFEGPKISIDGKRYLDPQPYEIKEAFKRKELEEDERIERFKQQQKQQQENVLQSIVIRESKDKKSVSIDACNLLNRAYFQKLELQRNGTSSFLTSQLKIDL